MHQRNKRRLHLEFETKLTCQKVRLLRAFPILLQAIAQTLPICEQKKKKKKEQAQLHERNFTILKVGNFCKYVFIIQDQMEK